MRNVLAVLVAVLALTACSQKQQTQTNSESSSNAQSTATAASDVSPAPATSAKLTVTFQFHDVAVTTSGNRTLRLGFDVKNGGSDPVLCEEGMFTLQLADGTVLNPDSGAENRCDPDTIDPGSTGKGTMFFDLKPGYSGNVTLMMTQDTALIGQGTTQVQ